MTPSGRRGCLQLHIRTAQNNKHLHMAATRLLCGCQRAAPWWPTMVTPTAGILSGFAVEGRPTPRRHVADGSVDWVGRGQRRGRLPDARRREAQPLEHAEHACRGARGAARGRLWAARADRRKRGGKCVRPGVSVLLGGARLVQLLAPLLVPLPLPLGSCRALQLKSWAQTPLMLRQCWENWRVQKV
jgi:hypothetical protein